MFDDAPLQEEFRIWREHGLTLPIWWRDDDAVRPSAALTRLTNLSEELAFPVHLAVIPSLLEPELVDYVRTHGTLRVLTHGWMHTNHAVKPDKSCEFPDGRDLDLVRHEIFQGADIMKQNFGSLAVPVFAPAWNRFSLTFAPLLAKAGYRALSQYTPRTEQMVADNLEMVNTHIDPIAWRTDRDLLPPAQIIAHTVDLLRDRRLGVTDPTEPLGYLTHHLDHTDNIWRFSKRFLSTLLQGPTHVVSPLPPHASTL